MDLQGHRISTFILYSYLLAVPFTHAYALHKWLPLPLTVLLCGMPLLFVSCALRPIKLFNRLFGLYDLWLLGFLLWLLLSLLLNARLAQKNLNHLIAFFTVASVYYFLIKLLLSTGKAPKSHDSYLRVLVFSFFITSIFVCLEFIDTNFFHYNVRGVLRYPADDNYSVLYAGIFYRARGFESESGNLALFLNVFFPLVAAYYHSTKRYLHLIAFLILYLLSLLFSFSAAGIFFIMLGTISALIVYTYDSENIDTLLKRVIILLCAFLVISILLVALVPHSFIEPIKDKVLLTDTSSAQGRLTRWSDALNYFKENPIIGTGIGSTADQYGTGVVSFYLLLLKETGMVGFILFLCFIASIFLKIIKMPKNSKYKYAYLISFVAGVGHYAVISDYWLPWIWLLFSLIVYGAAKCKTNEKQNGAFI